MSTVADDPIPIYVNQWLRFKDVTPEGRKTKVVAVVSDTHGDVLGHIKWFGRWRQYAFFPEAGTVWNPDCMTGVSRQIKEMMSQRRRQLTG